MTSIFIAHALGMVSNQEMISIVQKEPEETAQQLSVVVPAED